MASLTNTSSLTARVVDPAVKLAIDTIVNKVLYPYQREDVLSTDRFRVNRQSRQTGKSFGKVLRRILRGIARKRDQIFLSAGADQSEELIEKAKQHLEAIKIGFDASEQDLGVVDGERITQRKLVLPQYGIRVFARPANPRTARGLTGDVFLDEFAHHRDDREIWAAVFPAISRNDGELDVASTPSGRQNKFYELCNNPDYGQQTITIHQAVAQGCPQNPEELRRAINDELLWRQEYLCEFVDEATAFLTLDMIRACEDEKLPRELDLTALTDHSGDVVVGVDIGRYHDLTAIWALDAIGGQLISRGLVELHATPFRTQFETLSKVMSCRCVRKCCVDASGLGMQLAEQLTDRFGSHRVEGHQFTANLKEEMAGKLRVRMEGRTVAIPADEKIRADLHSIEKSVTIDGKIRLRATRKDGSHADRFWSLALAVYAAADDVATVGVHMGPKKRSAFARAGTW